MAEFDISPEDLQRLVRVVEENGLSELRYQEGDLRITLRTHAYRPAAAVVPVAHAMPLAAPVEDSETDYPRAHAEEAASSTPTVAIEAPVMGVFYRSPSPDDPPLVEVGDLVSVGQPVGLIEAMKVFSEVLSEHTGRVRAIPALNGALVHPHDPLVVLEAGGA